jgi:hypothetical protein
MNADTHNNDDETASGALLAALHFHDTHLTYFLLYVRASSACMIYIYALNIYSKIRNNRPISAL